MKNLKLNPIAWALLTLFSAASNAQSVLDLGSLGGESDAAAISADGSTVVGYSFTSNGSSRLQHAYRWSLSEGIRDLAIPQVTSEATGVSRDGSVVSGTYYSLALGGARAFRWTAATGAQDLGTLGGNRSAGAAISQDGTTVVGQSFISNGVNRAFRWTAATGMVNLGVLGTGTTSGATAVSSDGSVVVGSSNFAYGSSEHAFRWTSAGMQDLGTLGGPQSLANGVSGNGEIVVGSSQRVSGGPVIAFRWSQPSGMQDLGLLSGTVGQSVANGVSGDGNVIVGTSNYADTFNYKAFRWTQSAGMQSVEDWLIGGGASTAGWDLRSATSTNEDGSVLVGYGRSPGSNLYQAWIARVSPFGTGVMQPANYLTSAVVARQSLQQANQYLSRMVLWGAHHRPLKSYGKLDSDSCFWVTGDAGNRDTDRKTSDTAGEVGICSDFADGAIRAGVGLGFGNMSQSMGQFGSTQTSGNHVVGEINYQSQDGLLLSVTGIYGAWSAHVNRGYVGASGTDYSKGSTGVTSSALRLRADLNDLWHLGGTSFTPYLALTATDTTTDGYTESGGGFPARFDAQTQRGLEARLGVAGTFNLNSSTRVRGTVEAIQRLESDTPRVSGQVLGLFSFNQSGASDGKDWVRVGVDVDHAIEKNKLLSLSLHAASTGDDPQVSGAVTLRIGF
jgi:probable HAF family extracellular repeat protein